jgi:hypothetical protein
MDVPINEAIQHLAGEEMKYCSCCKTLKPVSEFHKNKASKDGLQPICKKCRAEKDRTRTTKAKAESMTIEVEPAQVEKVIVPKKPADPNIIITNDGRKLVRKESSDNKSLDQYTPREILAELKRRGYVWTEMWIKQTIDYDKI